MTDEMKKRIGEVLFVAPWTELDLEVIKLMNVEFNKILTMK